MKLPIVTKYLQCMPLYKTAGAAGADLIFASEHSLFMAPNQIYMIPTGVSVQIPKGYYGMTALRSSLGKQGLTMPNGVGIIDSDYRGEIYIPVIHREQHMFKLSACTRIGQIVIQPCIQAEFEIVGSLNETERGKGGFGSTGA